MPRKPGVWKRAGTDWFYTTIGKEKVRLSKDRKEAKKLMHQLHAEKQDEPEPPKQLGMSFRKLADEYLVHTQAEKNAESLNIQRRYLKDFSDHLKGLRAADVRGHMVTKWLAWENAWRAKAGRKLWGISTKALAIKTIKAVFNWGQRVGHLTVNPIKSLPRGKVVRRDRILTSDERQKIRDFVSPDFADFLCVVEHTGARPYSEIARLEAHHIDFEKGTATLYTHKTSRKTGKPRTIFFTPETLALLRRRVERYPTGLLFRTRRGSGWNRNNSRKWMSAIKDELGIDAFVYAFRHTMATNALIQGVPVEVLAELLGNTPAVLHAHYSHVVKDQDALRAAAIKAASGLGAAIPPAA